jgi:hypothetical protein
MRELWVQEDHTSDGSRDEVVVAMVVTVVAVVAVAVLGMATVVTIGGVGREVV